MVDFSSIQYLVVRIRESVNALIQKIIDESKGEPFYGRINLVDDERLVGLISDLSVNSSYITFSLTEKKVVNGQISSTTQNKKITFGKIKSINPFETQSGKPIIILPDDFTK